MCMQTGLILQESTCAQRHGSIKLSLEGELQDWSVTPLAFGNCTSLHVPTCWQDLPLYHNAYIRPGQK